VNVALERHHPTLVDAPRNTIREAIASRLRQNARGRCREQQRSG
jgi:hypothetical protein